MGKAERKKSTKNVEKGNARQREGNDLWKRKSREKECIDGDEREEKKNVKQMSGRGKRVEEDKQQRE